MRTYVDETPRYTGLCFTIVLWAHSNWSVVRSGRRCGRLPFNSEAFFADCKRRADAGRDSSSCARPSYTSHAATILEGGHCNPKFLILQTGRGRTTLSLVTRPSFEALHRLCANDWDRLAIKRKRAIAVSEASFPPVLHLMCSREVRKAKSKTLFSVENICGVPFCCQAVGIILNKKACSPFFMNEEPACGCFKNEVCPSDRLGHVPV